MDGKLYKKLQEAITDCLLEEVSGKNGSHANEEAYFSTLASNITLRLDKLGIKVIETNAPEIPVREEPVLVGHTTKRWGENGYHICEIGTPVYEFEGGYFIESHHVSPTAPVKRVRFHKDRFDMLNPIDHAKV